MLLTISNDPIAQFFMTLLTFSLSNYENYMESLYTNIFYWFVQLILIKMFFMLLFELFPFVKRLTLMIFKPFTMLHTLAHIHKAKQINAKTAKNKLKRADKNDLEYNIRLLDKKLYVRSSFFFGDQNHEGTRLAMFSAENLTYKEVMAFAFAPSRYAYLMTFIELLLVPLVSYSSLFGLIHMYIFLGTIIVLYPSNADYEYVYNTMIVNNTVNPIFWMWGGVIFVILSYIQFHFYAEINFPPYWYINTLSYALFVVVLYYLAIILVIRFTSTDETLKTADSYTTAQLSKLFSEVNKNEKLKELNEEEYIDLLNTLLIK